jgi:hypothetical protein
MQTDLAELASTVGDLSSLSPSNHLAIGRHHNLVADSNVRTSGAPDSHRAFPASDFNQENTVVAVVLAVNHPSSCPGLGCLLIV